MSAELGVLLLLLIVVVVFALYVRFGPYRASRRAEESRSAAEREP